VCISCVLSSLLVAVFGISLCIHFILVYTSTYSSVYGDWTVYIISVIFVSLNAALHIFVLLFYFNTVGGLAANVYLLNDPLSIFLIF